MSSDLPLTVRVRSAGKVVVVEVSGDLDMFTAGQLEAALTPVARGTTACIDLTGCGYIDSAGYRRDLRPGSCG